jgi:integrase
MHPNLPSGQERPPRSKAEVDLPVPPSTVRQSHHGYSLSLALAVRDGRLPHNVATGVKLPRVGRAEKTFLSHVQVADLAEAAGPYGIVVAVPAYTGLRWGELAALRVKRVDLTRRRLTVHDRDQRQGRLRHAQIAPPPLGADPAVSGRPAKTWWARRCTMRTTPPLSSVTH